MPPSSVFPTQHEREQGTCALRTLCVPGFPTWAQMQVLPAMPRHHSEAGRAHGTTAFCTEVQVRVLLVHVLCSVHLLPKSSSGLSCSHHLCLLVFSPSFLSRAPHQPFFPSWSLCSPHLHKFSWIQKHSRLYLTLFCVLLLSNSDS